MGNKHLKRKSAGHEYRRYVPKTLRPFAGKSCWIAYYDKTVARIDAEREADALDAKHDALIWRLRNLTDEDRAKLAAIGGIDRALTEEHADALAYFSDVMEREIIAADPISVPPTHDLRRKPHDPARSALQLFNAKRSVDELRKEAKARLIGGNAKDELRDDRGLGSLLQFANSDNPAGVKRTRRYLIRFKAHLGRDVEPSTVTQQNVVDWRNALKAEGYTPVNIAQHVAKISALFANAVSDGKLEANPFAGIKVRGKAKKTSDKKRAPTPDELRAFMSKASVQSVPFYTIARCLLFAGARSSEIADLRVGDVRQIENVWCYDINDAHRTLKKGAIRIVPIAAAVLADVLALTKGRPGNAPLFEGIPAQAAGPGHWWQGVASKIMIAVRGDDKTLSAHGLRHLWTNIADDNGVEEDVGCYVQGHSMGKTVRARIYKTRPAMGRLTDGVEKVGKKLSVMLR